MRRAERKIQLSHNIVGDTDLGHEREDRRGVEANDLRSIILGLQMFDPTDISDEKSDQLKASELSSTTEKVIAMRYERISGEDNSKFEINSTDRSKECDLIRENRAAFYNFDAGLDESSYLTWVKEFEEASQSNNDLEVLNRRRYMSEGKNRDVDAERKEAEEKKLAKWEAKGYNSLSLKDPPYPINGDMISESGCVQFVYGDCTHPEKVCPAEPAIILSCVDNSGSWGHGGMFDALAKLSGSIPEAYQRSSEFKDLHLGDVHLIEIKEECTGMGKDVSPPRWVALAVVQSYNARRKVPRSEISMSDLECCLSKASFAAAEKSASIHMPRIGYQDASGRSEWYTVERLLRKYASIYGINIYVYYFKRDF